MASAYSTENHQYAYRVRNMLNAAGIEAEVRPHYQIVGGMKEWLVEAPWYVMVPETQLERARDLAERWRVRFEE